MMKNKAILALGVAALTLMGGCQLDNYDYPDCQVAGRIVYDGQPLGLKGTEHPISMELWERGYGKDMPQTVYVSQSGTFSTYVYGEHPVRLVAKDGAGPWENRHDTIYIDNVGKGIVVDYPVVPYFIIKNEKYELSADSVLTAKFIVQQVSEQAELSSVGLVVNYTKYIDTSINAGSVSGTGNIGECTLSMDLKDVMKAQKNRHVFARVYVKNKGVDEALYSLNPEQIK